MGMSNEFYSSNLVSGVYTWALYLLIVVGFLVILWFFFTVFRKPKVLTTPLPYELTNKTFVNTAPSFTANEIIVFRFANNLLAYGTINNIEVPLPYQIINRDTFSFVSSADGVTYTGNIAEKNDSEGLILDLTDQTHHWKLKQAQ